MSRNIYVNDIINIDDDTQFEIYAVARSLYLTFTDVKDLIGN